MCASGKGDQVMPRMIGLDDDVEVIIKNPTQDQIESLTQQLKEAKNQMIQFQMELKIKEQENQILNQQINHDKLKTSISVSN